jgi:hypothetical protein
MDERVEAFLADVLALEGETIAAVRRAVRAVWRIVRPFSGLRRLIGA